MLSLNFLTACTNRRKSTLLPGIPANVKKGYHYTNTEADFERKQGKCKMVNLFMLLWHHLVFLGKLGSVLPSMATVPKLRWKPRWHIWATTTEIDVARCIQQFWLPFWYAHSHPGPSDAGSPVPNIFWGNWIIHTCALGLTHDKLCSTCRGLIPYPLLYDQHVLSSHPRSCELAGSESVVTWPTTQMVTNNCHMLSFPTHYVHTSTVLHNPKLFLSL